MVANISLDGNEVVNKTYISKIKDDNSLASEILPKTETRFCLLANLFCSEGKTSNVSHFIINCFKTYFS